MNEPIDEPVDVLIAGGGPIGVTTAILLAQRGFSVRVLERATEIYDLPRAIVMDDEIQRIFQNAGLIDELRTITTPLRGAEFVSVEGERIVGAELPSDVDWPLGHHPGVTYYQPELEAFLRRCAERAGVELCLGVEAGEVSQRPDAVDLRFDDHGDIRGVEEFAKAAVKVDEFLFFLRGALFLHVLLAEFKPVASNVSQAALLQT